MHGVEQPSQASTQMYVSAAAQFQSVSCLSTFEYYRKVTLPVKVVHAALIFSMAATGSSRDYSLRTKYCYAGAG